MESGRTDSLRLVITEIDTIKVKPVRSTERMVSLKKSLGMQENEVTGDMGRQGSGWKAEEEAGRRDCTHQSLHSPHSIIGLPSFPSVRQRQYNSSFFPLFLGALDLPFALGLA